MINVKISEEYLKEIESLIANLGHELSYEELKKGLAKGSLEERLFQLKSIFKEGKYLEVEHFIESFLMPKEPRIQENHYLYIKNLLHLIDIANYYGRGIYQSQKYKDKTEKDIVDQMEFKAVVSLSNLNRKSTIRLTKVGKDILKTTKEIENLISKLAFYEQLENRQGYLSDKDRVKAEAAFKKYQQLDRRLSDLKTVEKALMKEPRYKLLTKRRTFKDLFKFLDNILSKITKKTKVRGDIPMKPIEIEMKTPDQIQPRQSIEMQTNL